MQMYMIFGAWLHKCFCFNNEDDVLMVQKPLLTCQKIKEYSHIVTNFLVVCVYNINLEKSTNVGNFFKVTKSINGAGQLHI